jgi:hypothetical protein
MSCETFILGKTLQEIESQNHGSPGVICAIHLHSSLYIVMEETLRNPARRNYLILCLAYNLTACYLFQVSKHAVETLAQFPVALQQCSLYTMKKESCIGNPNKKRSCFLNA